MVCFHNPEEENGYLSNWYPSSFMVDEITFSSMEQYMMYEKAILFQDYQIAERILKTDDVAEIKTLGRMVQHFDEEIWREKREAIVFKGIFQKFLQNPELSKKLIETGEQIIAECAVKDKIWGIGLSMQDKDRFCVDKWRGQNLLGQILMQVRQELY